MNLRDWLAFRLGAALMCDIDLATTVSHVFGSALSMM
jgi:hypothetical protein